MGAKGSMMTYEMTEEEPRTVVIVEDESDLAELFAVWLGKTYSVTIANDCATAFELIDDTVDVALLDRQLPDGTGGEILTMIRDRGLNCRVAMVSAVEPNVDIIEMGFDEYLCKPVAKTELHDTVERLIAQGAYGDALTEYYGLASKKSLLESHRSQGELADSEAFAELEERIEMLDRELSQMVNTLSETQIAAEFRLLPTEAVKG